MAEKASFSVDLQDNVSKGANTAAASIERLKKKIQDEQKALKDLQSAMGRLKGNSADVTAAKKELAKKIDATKASIGQAQAAYIKGGGSLAKLGEKAKESGSKLGALKTFAAGSGAAIASLVAIVVAAGAAFVGFGIAMVDAARSARLLTEAQTGSAKGGEQIEKWVQSISKKVPLARDQIRGLVGALTDKGLQGNKLAHALSAVSTATAVLGGSAGGKLQTLAEQAQLTKRLMIGINDLHGTGIKIDDVAAQLAIVAKTSVGAAKAALQSGRVEVETGLKALDKAVQARLGGIAAKQLKSLPMQFEKAKEKIADLFANINIEPLLDALEKMLSLLDANTASGQALQTAFKMIVQPIGDALVAVMPLVGQFIRGFIIGGLEVTKVMLKLAISIKKAVPRSVVEQLSDMTTAMEAGKIAAYALAVVIGLVAAAVLTASAPILALGAAIMGIVKAYKAFRELTDRKKLADVHLSGGRLNTTRTEDDDYQYDMGAKLKELSAKNKDPKAAIAEAGGSGAKIGQAMALGLAQGINENADKVAQAAADMGTGAHDALKKAIDAHSPSRLFAQSGKDTAEGYAMGVSDNAPTARESLYSMVTPEDARRVGENGQPTKASSGPTKIDRRSFTFSGMGAEDRAWFRREMQAFLDRELATQGA